jgi:hypothetical protein
MDKDAWRRRQAIQIAAQLPEEPEDALAILEHAKDLVEKFLSPRDAQEGSVVAFRRSDALSNR